MRITVGIFQNVIIEKAGINDKGRLTLSFRQLGEEKKEAVDNPFDQMNASEVIEDEKGGDRIILWPFKLVDEKTKDGTILTTKERGELANGDITRLKNQCQLILEQYMTKDNIKWSIFDGAPLTKEGYYEELCSQSVLDIIYRNICEQFVGMMQPFLDNDAHPMRLKLVRQSVDKHYAKLPDRYITSQPFLEPMDVPEAQTKVKWSDYEIKNKLNDGTPVSRSTADTDTEATPEGENVFGQR